MNWSASLLLLVTATTTFPETIAFANGNGHLHPNELESSAWNISASSKDPILLPSTNCTESDPRVMELVVKLAASLAKSGDYDEASQELARFSGSYASKLLSVIDRLYNGSLESTEHILELLAFSTTSACHRGLKSLHQKMEKLNRLDEPDILIVAYLQANFTKACYPIKLMSELSPHVDKVLNRWAADILNGTLDHILEFEKVQWPSFSFYLDSVIKRTYAMDSNATSALMKFAKGLPWLLEWGMSIESITRHLNELGRSHSAHMVTVAHWVHKHQPTNRSKLSTDAEDIIEAFAKAKENIPSEISDLFWKPSRCTLRNLHWNEFLFARRNIRASKEQVFLAGGEEGKLYGEKEWTLESCLDEEKELHFTVQNNFTLGASKYLCESVKNVGVPGMCSELDDDSQGYRGWYIYPTVWNGTVDAFLVKNSPLSSGHDDYLTAEEERDEAGRRGLRNGRMEETSLWKIDCFDETSSEIS